MENVLRWGCICDACDREGRYHTVGDYRGDSYGFGPDREPPKKQQKSWLRRLIERIFG